MQVAGGLDHLTIRQKSWAGCCNPKYITILAPIVTYFDYLCWYWQHLSGDTASYR